MLTGPELAKPPQRQHCPSVRLATQELPPSSARSMHQQLQKGKTPVSPSDLRVCRSVAPLLISPLLLCKVAAHACSHALQTRCCMRRHLQRAARPRNGPAWARRRRPWPSWSGRTASWPRTRAAPTRGPWTLKPRWRRWPGSNSCAASSLRCLTSLQCQFQAFKINTSSA